jgi:ATP-dependent exoDNAse (exonuclease V) beta subunit
MGFSAMSKQRSPVSPPFLAIRAAAGTGKTYSLTRRYLTLVDRGVSARDILAATFTRKAATEITGRIFSRLAESIIEPSKRQDLADFLGRKTISNDETARLLDHLVDHWPALRIGTLDKFFTEIARDLSFELGLPPGWSVLDDIDDQPLRAEGLADMLEEQGHDAVAQLARLLFKGESRRSIHEEIDSITTELHEIWLQVPRDAWEVLPAAAELLPHELDAVLKAIETYPLESSLTKARDRDLEFARTGDWKTIIDAGLVKAIIEGKESFSKKPIPEDLRRLYLPLIEHTRAQRQNPLVHQNRATALLLSAYDAHYRLRQFEAGGLRFSDVTRVLMEAASASNESLRWLQETSHLLLDEFQDTSVAQWKVLLPVVKQCSQSSAGTIFIVGDPKQAIYGWRGGAAELMETLDDAIPHLHHDDLVQSRRSSPIIIDFVNTIFGSISQNAVIQAKPYLARAAREWSTRFVTHSAAHEDRPGYVALHVPPGDESDHAIVDPFTHAAELVKQIRQQAPPATIGILVRKNDSVATMLSELRSRGIDASQEGGSSIASNPAVGQILSWLTWLDHPGDTASYFHVAHSIWGDRLGLSSNPADSGLIAQKHRRLLSTQGYGPTIEDWVDTLSPNLDDRNVRRLQQLIELARAFDDRPLLRPSDFVDFVETTRVDDPRPAPVRVMNIHQSKGLEFDIVLLPELDSRLRGNNSKLLVGWDDILAPATVACRYTSEAEQQLLPERIQEAFQEQLVRESVEQISLLYVAVTRAKYQLHLVIAPPLAREKTTPATMAGIIRAGLELKSKPAPGHIAWSSGEPSSHQNIVNENLASPPVSIRLTPRSQAPPTTETTRLVNPSAIHLQRMGLRERLTRTERSAAERGSLIHAWLSRWSWIDETPPDDADLLAMARNEFSGQSNPEGLLAEVKATLEKPGIRDVFTRPAGQFDLWRERRFIVETNTGFISGTFDRVVVLRSGEQVEAARIFDFKTDRLHDEGGVEARARHYRQQLELYRFALATMLNLPTSAIDAELLFLSVGIRWKLSKEEC